MRFTLLPLILSCFSTISLAQQVSWHQTNSPPAYSRYDDIFFFDENFGFAADFGGRVLKTRDGGQNWQVLAGPIPYGNRSIMFFDTLNGVMGDLFSTILTHNSHIFETHDGGNTWDSVPNFPGPRDQGICGMCRLNDSIGFAVGRWSGPASFFRTTDKGATWTYTDLSVFMSGAVDVYFWTKDSGIVIGSYGLWNNVGTNYVDSGGIVLGTSNGGATWEVRHKINIVGSLCWKIQFPSADIGYVSLEQLNKDSTYYFLKSTDHGYTWSNMVYHTGSYYNAEGIGFLNNILGWLGGGLPGGFRTEDGGSTWMSDSSVDIIMDRVRKVSDTVVFSSGEYVNRYGLRQFIITNSASQSMTSEIKMFPNPAIQSVKLLLRIPHAAVLSLAIYDLNGKKIYERPAQFYDAGDNYLNIQLHGITKGEYLTVFSNNKFSIARPLIIQ